MSLSKDDILNAIAEMSVMDVVELVSAMEEKFGVSAAAAVVAGPAPVEGRDSSITINDRLGQGSGLGLEISILMLYSSALIFCGVRY